MAAAPPAFEVGETVWLRHSEHSWLLGTVQEIGAKNLMTCVAQDSSRGIVGERVQKLRPELDVQPVLGETDEDVNDLLLLTSLSDATLIRCLAARYDKDICYTALSSITVALNPFNFKIPWYTDDNMPKYLAEGPRISDALLPHSWAQAHNTYWELLDATGPEGQQPQTILVSGESGAGKTEASKIVLKYFTALSDRAAGGAGAAAAAGGGKSQAESVAGGGAASGGGQQNQPENQQNQSQDSQQEVGKRLVQCSPILESFGNARTVRNDNSSRFGKFMKIQFSERGVLLGAQITRYLLEKSRIIQGARGERVYHAFYLVCRGEYAREFHLLQDKEYRSLNSGNQLNNSDFDTAEEFTEVVQAMHTIGLDDAAIHSVWATVAAINTLLNVEFTSDGGEGSIITGAHQQTTIKAAGLLEVDADKLQSQMVQSEIEVRGEVSVKLHPPVGATDIRDALCKAVYDALFGVLCDKCNDMCDAHTDDSFWVGLLDIFGFEDFEKNSFEQLCINLANETLQNHYNNYIFARDMEECAAEGVDTADIVCPDNTPCLVMISDPRTGIFALLDDECSLGKGSDKGFLDATVAKFRTHQDFITFKVAKVPSFGVRHYAGDVTYDVNNFLEKNRDTLKDSLRLLMRESGAPLIADLLSPPVKKSGRAVTVSGFFRTQVKALMDVINSSNPHWIRCIKPHPAKKPKMFHGHNTMLQLESSGVLGTVKIRKAGYPVRIPFKHFVERFMILLPQAEAAKLYKAKDSMTLAEARAKAVLMLGRVDVTAVCPQPTMCQVGKTKVFLKSEALTPLERMRRDEHTARIVTVQKAGRALRSRRQTWQLALEAAARLIVFEWRDFLERNRVQRELAKERDRVFRAAMLEGTTELETGFKEAAQLAFDECAAGLVDVYIEALLEREPLLRADTLQEESDEWFRILVSLGGELLDLSERDRRAGIELAWAHGFNLCVEESVEWQIFSNVLLAERDIRVDLEKDMLEELRVAAGDPEVRMTLMLGMEVYQREQIALEGLAAFAGWLAAHMREKNADFFQSEQDGRRALLDEEVFERDVRKRFERKRVWFALIAAMFADEEYDRDFLWRAEALWRADIAQAMRSDDTMALGASREQRERLSQAEARGRFELLQAESDVWGEVIMPAFEAERWSILRWTLEGDEENFRRIVNEAFFATLAVAVPEEMQELYFAFVRYC